MIANYTGCEYAMNIKSILQFGIAAFLLYFPFIWCRMRNEDPDSYGLNWRFTASSFKEMAYVTFSTLFILTIIAFNWPTEDLPRYSPIARTLNLLGAGIAAACIEEVFFRGWMQTLFRKRFSAVSSIFSVSLLFALAHVIANPLIHSLAVFFPGLIMGFLRERHGNLASSTAFHAIANIWAIWFSPSIWLP